MSAYIKTPLLLQDVFKYKDLDCLDAAENVHFSRELESLIPDLVKKAVAPTSVRSLFPVDTAYSPNTKTITWRQLTVTGAARIISDYDDNFPLINMFAEEKTTQVRTLGLAHKQSIDELSGSAEGSINLDAEGRMAVRDGLLRKENTLAYEGDTKFDMVGLFSGVAVTGISETNSAGVWSGATQATIYQELSGLPGDVHEDSKTVHNATRILMSPANYRIINTTPYSTTTTNETTLEVFRRNHPGVEVIPVQEMSGAAAKGGLGGTTDAVFAYSPNMDEIRLALPMAIQQLKPFERHQTVETAYRSRTGGFIIRKPMGMKFLLDT